VAICGGDVGLKRRTISGNIFILKEKKDGEFNPDRPDFPEFLVHFKFPLYLKKVTFPGGLLRKNKPKNTNDKNAGFSSSPFMSQTSKKGTTKTRQKGATSLTSS